MTIMEAMEARHAVRSYKDKKIEHGVAGALKREINECNQEGSLSIQLILDDKDVFQGLMAYFAGFRGVSNYIALVGPTGSKSEEKLGYYGERIALKAQQLGLNTCWVAATFKRERCKAVIGNQEALIGVLALGYGTTQGIPHKSKPMDQLCKADQDMPEWFGKGMKAAALAPTAQNKQDFLIVLNGDQVEFEAKESKFRNVDLGIIKYHFENGAKQS